MVEPNNPSEKPRHFAPTLQVAIAMACGLLVAETVDWVTAVHVLLAVLSVFTSINRAATANRRCAHCGHRQ
ncbi:hypothetical protein [Mycolicibacter sinensis]|uniref:hypothetical protein n=1 Tax=Mycolicibacter sinensis (strain JDM601) TaxID=875328 RepID=UPI0007EB12A2|nr:hypothetical protein [Mycolicibacter sinensis]OBH20419.1 hypothetical protein A5694_16350 [Mycolicibacter sinensis]